MKFTKMQGAGNDYVLIETGDKQRDWSQLAITVCDRHYGIGADSLLLLIPSDKADCKMRIFDSDGSEAEACGNGTRCLAKYIFEKGLVSNGAGQALIETISGIRKVKYYKREGRLTGIQANMGKPAFRAEDIPVIIKSGDNVVDIKSLLGYTVNVDGTELILHLVSMGNPHAIYFSQQPVADFPLSRIGPLVERLDIFPKRTNFEVVNVINKTTVQARVWERGVGETLACGSGACAIVVAAQLLGYTEKKADVELPGGVLQLEWNGEGEVLLSGPAEIVFAGEWPGEV